ncbi:hypothetical protein LZ906_017525 (plasmid) [Paraclostridium ghonii]|uniref:hypothetical protein n=1 Tax=Paraclostridium ghonii TaxID=29358 RepID=UPI00202CCB79|nr:hypothetical protein [Paeniclostridium ghonii]MCM0166541.1 hypothetical protein [Paeniclostridium ghonii]
MEQITKDKDFISLYDNNTSFLLAYKFALNDRCKDNYKHIMDVHTKLYRGGFKWS